MSMSYWGINGIGVNIEKIKPFLSPGKTIKALTEHFCVYDDVEGDINNCLKAETQKEQINMIAALFEECNGEKFTEMVATAICEGSIKEKKIPLTWASDDSDNTYVFLERLFPHEYNEWYKVPDSLAVIKEQIVEQILKICSDDVDAETVKNTLDDFCVFCCG